MNAAIVEPRYGTRWGRTLVPMVVGFALVGILTTLIWRQVFALELTMQGTAMSFSSTAIVGQDVGMGMVPIQTSAQANKPVLRAGLAVASINGLCISKTETIAGIAMTLKLTSGDSNAATREISAKNAVFDLTTAGDLGGTPATRRMSVVLQGAVQLGLASTDLTTIPGGTPYVPNPIWPVTDAADNPIEVPGNGQGWTGVDATGATLSNVYGTMWDAQVGGNVVLPKLKIEVIPGTAQSCAAAAMAGTFPN